MTVHTQDIGGPSAGLAMTLGIIDKLSSGRLTGNRIVAATGTIDQNGNVGDVGRRGREDDRRRAGRGDRLLRARRSSCKTAEAKASPAAPRLRREQPRTRCCASSKRLGGNVHQPSLCRPRRRRRLWPCQKAAPPSPRPASRPGTSPGTPSPSSGGASTPTRCGPTCSRCPAASRRSRSASRSCGPRWPRPRSGRPTRWSTRRR